MKKVTKLLAVVLAFILLITPSSFAFAKSKTVTPVIIIHGLGGSDFYRNIGTEDETKIPQFGIDLQSMLGDETIRNELIKLFTDTKKPNYNKLFKALGSYFAGQELNYKANGTAKSGNGIINYWEDSLAHHKEYLTLRDFSVPVFARQISAQIGSKNVYAFNYDWRADMCDSAKQLRKMIVKVKKNTGAKKVTLVALSLGGAVVSAYMDAYKQKKDVERYVLVNPAYEGVDVARAFTFDFRIDAKALIKYLKHLETAFNAGSKETLFKAITALGDERISVGAKKLNKDVLQNSKRRKQFFLKTVKPWIGNLPVFYELLPYSQFNKAVKTLSSIGYLDKSSGLYKKIKHYHAVQGRFKKNLKWVKKHGAEVAIIANYGTMGLPVTSKLHNHTDLLIDTKYASVGATVAQYGKKLSSKNAKGKYVSPDKVINAKTCALPDNTWFITGIIHGLYSYNGKASKFIANLSTGKVKCNLKAVKKKYGYSQFLKADIDQKLTNVKK